MTSFRSGFISFVGRPNVGKSTLMNALVGQKVAIMSDRPQTTRRAIRGIVNRPEAQVIVVDTPGLHRPRTLLGERLNDLVQETVHEVDVVACCIPANETIGPGDRFIVSELAAVKAPIFAVVTKTDLVTPAQLMQQLAAVSGLADWAEIVPVSARTATQTELLLELIIGYLPEGMPLYPQDAATDEPEQIMIAEFVREAALSDVREELPHSIAVLVDEIVPRSDEPNSLVDVRVHIYVERSSQKGIIIGRGGSRLREVGAQARQEIEQLLGRRVFLDLHVKVAKDWQRDPKLLRRLGF